MLLSRSFCALGSVVHKSLAVLGLGVAAVVGSAAYAQVQPEAGMLRYPDISASSIVFVYADDLWVVDRTGGVASPLASPVGPEMFPKFSDDGRTIAFVGNYDGGTDLYTIPASGGLPFRVTYHPNGEMLSGWTPDDGLIFMSSRQSGQGRAAKIFTIPEDGGLAEALPVPYGGNGAISPDGQWLAYTPHPRDMRSWKRYRGGAASNIWLFNRNTNESRQVTEWEGTDSIPMWHGRDLYYLSDRGPSHKLNIWKYDTQSRSHAQITDFSDYDVKFPSVGPGPNGGGEIVFQQGRDLYVLDLDTRKTRTVDVTIPGARASIRPRSVDVSGSISAGDISATGKRVVVEARGDIWTLPAEKGYPRNLTSTSGVAERMPAWSPDGRWIAYFSDATGEYEMYITQSDGKGETKKVTSGNEWFLYSPQWSPDSKHIVYSDNTGAMYLHTLETEDAPASNRRIGEDPTGFGNVTVSWSHDARWIAYERSGDDMINNRRSIYLYDVENDSTHQVTSGFFDDNSPAFDRKGDYLYFVSNRSVGGPKYSSIDSTFIYDDSEKILAVPLRADVEYPWTPEADEETWEDESDEEDESESDEGDDDEGDDEDEDEAEKSPLHGKWEGTIKGLAAAGMPEDEVPFSMTIFVDEEGNISGTTEMMGESDSMDNVTFNEDTGEFYEESVEQGMTSIIQGKLVGDTITGTWQIKELGISGTWEAKRTTQDIDEDEAGGGDDDKPAEVVEIDLDGFEQRAIMLPIDRGSFGNLAVNHKNQLFYVRYSGGAPAIKMFDINDDDDGEPEEKSVTAGAGFMMSGDGKKIGVYTLQGGLGIASATGGATAKPVPTDNMIAMIEPKEEWKQLFTDSWRLYRQFFYVGNMHGVDWQDVYDMYMPMVEDAASRDDLNYIIKEMIAELNSGHTYAGGGDVEFGENVSVGMLGVDFELANGAYRIKNIVEGGAHDADARNPLLRNGVDVKEGDYLLAVNGIPLDTSREPWAAFRNLAGKHVELTVSETPDMTDEARTVMVKTMGGEGGLRYRAWIEKNRQYVEEQSNGDIGYIHVPDTGINGQSELFRQFFGQAHKKALIIDERWNGGGQLPNRFIELMNRPVTNYWARRHGKNWRTPGPAHIGPKCMLINGPSGSGGDMFPFLFKQAGLGKLIGRRTWGGLIGLTGGPSLIDGGYVAVPTFGFYETDGTWGIEGHGVDPDMEVIDDPALMIDGGDPQLDAAIEQMKKEIRNFDYSMPGTPPAPVRTGIGIAEDDK